MVWEHPEPWQGRPLHPFLSLRPKTNEKPLSLRQGSENVGATLFTIACVPVGLLRLYGGSGKRVARAIAPTPFLAKVFGVAEAGILALFRRRLQLRDSAGLQPASPINPRALVPRVTSTVPYSIAGSIAPGGREVKQVRGPIR